MFLQSFARLSAVVNSILLVQTVAINLILIRALTVNFKIYDGVIYTSLKYIHWTELADVFL